MVGQGREFGRDEVLQLIAVTVEAVRGESAGRRLSFLEDGGGGGDSGGSSDGDGDGGRGGGGGGGGSGVAILHANVTALLLNPFTIERALLLAPRGCFAGFRLIMTVSTHRNLSLPVPTVPPSRRS